MRTRVAGGAAKLGTELAANAYRYATGRIVAMDILGGAGEQLSPAADSSALAAIFPAYARLAGPAGAALQILAGELGASWPVLADGTVWLGHELWPSCDLTDDLVIDRGAEDGRASLGVALPTALPGTTFDGRRIGRVIHYLHADRVRTELVFDDE